MKRCGDGRERDKKEDSIHIHACAYMDDATMKQKRKAIKHLKMTKRRKKKEGEDLSEDEG